MLVDAVTALDKPWSNKSCRRDLSISMPLVDCWKLCAICRCTIVSRIQDDRCERHGSRAVRLGVALHAFGHVNNETQEVVVGRLL